MLSIYSLVITGVSSSGYINLDMARAAGADMTLAPNRCTAEICKNKEQSTNNNK